MAVDPFSYKDQHTQEWQQARRALEASYSPPPTYKPPPTYDPPPIYNPPPTYGRRATSEVRTPVRQGNQPIASDGSAKSFEEVLAGLVGVAVWVGLSYYGITELALPWYWPVGIGFVVARVTCKLLMGPLYFVLTATKWLICLSMLAFLGCVIFKMTGH